MSTPSDEEVEAAAKAMWANDRTWPDASPIEKSFNRSLAKVALVAAAEVRESGAREET